MKQIYAEVSRGSVTILKSPVSEVWGHLQWVGHDGVGGWVGGVVGLGTPLTCRILYGCGVRRWIVCAPSVPRRVGGVGGGDPTPA